MANAKKTKPREPPRWRASLTTKIPAKYIDFTRAPNAETTERQEPMRTISEGLPQKLGAIREEPWMRGAPSQSNKS
jgi:hypothetical protein